MTPEQIWEALKSAPKIAGPWIKHEHGFGCDCSSYPVESPFRAAGGWWYRENIDGKEVAFDFPDRPTADAKLREEGWLLVNEEEKS